MRVGGQEFWWVGLTGACGIEVSVNVVGTGFSVHMCGHSRMDFHCVLALALACSAHRCWESRYLSQSILHLVLMYRSRQNVF